MSYHPPGGSPGPRDNIWAASPSIDTLKLKSKSIQEFIVCNFTQFVNVCLKAINENKTRSLEKALKAIFPAIDKNTFKNFTVISKLAKNLNTIDDASRTALYRFFEDSETMRSLILNSNVAFEHRKTTRGLRAFMTNLLIDDIVQNHQNFKLRALQIKHLLPPKEAAAIIIPLYFYHAMEIKNGFSNLAHLVPYFKYFQQLPDYNLDIVEKACGDIQVCDGKETVYLPASLAHINHFGYKFLSKELQNQDLSKLLKGNPLLIKLCLFLGAAMTTQKRRNTFSLNGNQISKHKLNRRKRLGMKLLFAAYANDKSVELYFQEFKLKPKFIELFQQEVIENWGDYIELHPEFYLKNAFGLCKTIQLNLVQLEQFKNYVDAYYAEARNIEEKALAENALKIVSDFIITAKVILQPPKQLTPKPELAIVVYDRDIAARRIEENKLSLVGLT